MCIATSAAPRAATTAAMRSSPRSPLMSFTISAPASIAASATSACCVSIDTGRSVALRMAATAGSARPASSSIVTGTASGRVDSAPTSMMSAPASANSRASAAAAVASAPTPSPLKESGVTFTIAIR